MPNLELEKATPLDTIYTNIYIDTLNNFNKVYLYLIRLKSFIRIYNTYYKV